MSASSTISDIRRLTFTCMRCAKPIDDGAGCMRIRHSEVHQIEDWDAEKTRAEVLAGRPTVYSVDDFAKMPKEASWQLFHFDCDPHPDDVMYAIEVDVLRTASKVLEWSAHLMEKRWLTHTNWNEWLRTWSTEV